MLTKRLCALLLVPVLGLLSTGNYVIAQEEAPVIERLQPEDSGTALSRSERLSSQRALLDLQNQIAGLEREIKRLRGELEEQPIAWSKSVNASAINTWISISVCRPWRVAR